MRIQRVRFIAYAIAIPLGMAILLSGGRSASAFSVCSGCAPTASEDNYKATFNTTLNVSAPGLLANDQGPTGTQVNVADSDSSSANGAAVTVHANGSFTYTPDPSSPFTGNDSFDYEISDAQGDFDTATVNIEVDPVVHDVTYSTPFQTPLHLDAPGVLAPDLGVDSVADSAAKSAHGGDVVVGDDGSVDYTPPHGFSGADTFSFTVNDLNFDNTFAATAHVNVGAAPSTTTVKSSTTTVRVTTTTTIQRSTTTTTLQQTTPTTRPPSTTTTVGALGAVTTTTTRAPAVGSAPISPSSSTFGEARSGQLPFTGAETVTLALFGIILIDLGWLAVAATRRRTYLRR